LLLKVKKVSYEIDVFISNNYLMHLTRRKENVRRKCLSIVKEKLNNFKYFNIYVCNLMMKSVSEREREREKVNFATVAIAGTIVTRRTDEENGIE